MLPRLYRLLACALSMIALVGLAAAPAPVRAEQRCFAETGQCIDGRIREFWEQNGGLPVFGYPITDQREETIEGKAVQAQWFERNRLELHPENAAPYDVLLGRLGVDRLAQQGRDWFQFPKGQAQDGCLFFSETGHSICGAILRAWRANGLEIDGRSGKSQAESLALFGLPLSEPAVEDTPSGQFTVQWFERARFELHPENAAPSDVLLGLLGSETLSSGGASSGGTSSGGASGGGAASSCGSVPAPSNAAIHPKQCISAGENATIDAVGFKPSELVSFWLTSPEGQVTTQEERKANEDGALYSVAFETSGLHDGLWRWAFQGQTSGNQAAVSFFVSGAVTAPLPTTAAAINWGEAHSITSKHVRAFFPWITVDSNNHSHIIYETGDGQLWYTNDVGGGMSTPQLIESDIGVNRDPFYALALGPGNTLHLAYALINGDRQIYYRIATLNGAIANWSDRQRISDGKKPYAAHLTVDGSGAAHIVWIDQNCGTYNVFYRVRYPDGRLSDTSAPIDDCTYQNRPQVAVTSDGKAHVVFQHNRDILYARKDPDGWVVQKLSKSSKTPSYNASITTDGARLFVAWDEGENNHDILMRRSDDGGANWQEPYGISDDSSSATYPNVTYSAARQQVYIVWSDVSSVGHHAPYVLFSAYDPASGNHTKPYRLAKNEGQGIMGVVGAGPGLAAVVWQDRSKPNWQIYHVTGTLGG